MRRSGSLIAGEGHTAIVTLIVGLYAEFTGHGEAAAWMITLCISQIVLAIGKLAWRGLTQTRVR